MTNLRCPLCEHDGVDGYFADSRRPYHQCRRCQLVFVPPAYRLSPELEKAEYDLHQNDPHDPGYRRFLSRAVAPLIQRLTMPARGLDFGCGPGPAMPLLLAEAGYEMEVYDIFYTPDERVLHRTYDFITCTEVVEHLHEPGRVMATLLTLLKPGGWLVIMTKLVQGRDAFSRWHYKNDPTHVVFFSRHTFKWMAKHYLLDLTIYGNDVMLIRKR